PRSAAKITIRASRGGDGSYLSRLPMAVILPLVSSASNSVSSSRAVLTAAAGGGSIQDSKSGSVVPHSAHASNRAVRSPERISGSAKADAGLSTASAAPPLIGGGARHAHSLEPRHANVRLETRNSRKTAVDDD